MTGAVGSRPSGAIGHPVIPGLTGNLHRHGELIVFRHAAEISAAGTPSYSSVHRELSRTGEYKVLLKDIGAGDNRFSLIVRGGELFDGVSGNGHAFSGLHFQLGSHILIGHGMHVVIRRHNAVHYQLILVAFDLIDNGLPKHRRRSLKYKKRHQRR